LALVNLLVLRTVTVETGSLLVLLGQMRLLHVLDGFRFRVVYEGFLETVSFPTFIFPWRTLEADAIIFETSYVVLSVAGSPWNRSKFTWQ